MAQQRIIIEDRSDYAKREFGRLYWQGNAWGSDCSSAKVYATIESAKAQVAAWVARHKASGSVVRPTWVIHFVDLDRLLASGKVCGATFRAALAQGLDRAAAYAVAEAAVAAAGLENVDVA